VKGKAVIGIGNIPFRSYWLTLFSPTGEIIWEGLVDAVEVNGGFQIQPQSIPFDIQMKLQQLGHAVRVTSAWEEVPRKLLSPPPKED
jgi:hypothetical protein